LHTGNTIRRSGVQLCKGSLDPTCDRLGLLFVELPTDVGFFVRLFCNCATALACTSTECMALLCHMMRSAFCYMHSEGHANWLMPGPLADKWLLIGVVSWHVSIYVLTVMQRKQKMTRSPCMLCFGKLSVFIVTHNRDKTCPAHT